MMEQKKKRDWGLVILGVLLALCGVFFILAPGMTLISLTIFIGVALLITGIYNIISFIRWRNSMEMSGWIIAYAIIDIILGLMFVIMPVTLSVVIPWFVGIFYVLFGIFEIVGSFRIRKTGFRPWGWMLVSGVLSVLFGILLFIFPPSISILIGVFAIMRGISMAIYGSTIDELLA